MSAKLTANLQIEIEINSIYHNYCGTCDYCEYCKTKTVDDIRYCHLFQIKMKGRPQATRCKQCIDAFGYPEAKDEPEY